MNKTQTVKQKRTYEELLPLIDQYKQRHGFSPSLREVAEFLGNTSTSHASHALNRLEEQGCISRPRRGGRVVPRKINIVGVY